MQPDENNETLLDFNACSDEKFAERETSIQNIERSSEILEHDTQTEKLNNQNFSIYGYVSMGYVRHCCEYAVMIRFQVL